MTALVISESFIALLAEIAARNGTTAQEVFDRLSVHTKTIAEILPPSALRPRKRTEDQSE